MLRESCGVKEKTHVSKRIAFWEGWHRFAPGVITIISKTEQKRRSIDIRDMAEGNLDYNRDREQGATYRIRADDGRKPRLDKTKKTKCRDS